MRRVRAALDRSALFQQGLPKVGNHIRDQLRLLVLWCEQHEIDEALNHHRCQVTQGSAPTFDAVLDKLIDLAVQAVGHHASSLQCTLSHSSISRKADGRSSAMYRTAGLLRLFRPEHLPDCRLRQPELT